MTEYSKCDDNDIKRRGYTLYLIQQQEKNFEEGKSLTKEKCWKSVF